jgi:hypothetical protein
MDDIIHFAGSEAGVGRRRGRGSCQLACSTNEGMGIDIKYLGSRVY